MKKVLVIDDAAFMRMSIKRMLENSGFEVVGEAEDGKAGIAKFQEVLPDIVTLDITMPKMDGLQTLKAIKEIDPKANIVMVSAMGQEQKVREAVMLGAKSFIVKPFEEKVLIGALEKI